MIAVNTFAQGFHLFLGERPDGEEGQHVHFFTLCTGQLHSMTRRACRSAVGQEGNLCTGLVIFFEQGDVVDVFFQFGVDAFQPGVNLVQALGGEAVLIMEQAGDVVTVASTKRCHRWDPIRGIAEGFISCGWLGHLVLKDLDGLEIGQVRPVHACGR